MVRVQMAYHTSLLKDRESNGAGPPVHPVARSIVNINDSNGRRVMLTQYGTYRSISFFVGELLKKRQPTVFFNPSGRASEKNSFAPSCFISLGLPLNLWVVFLLARRLEQGSRKSCGAGKMQV